MVAYGPIKDLPAGSPGELNGNYVPAPETNVLQNYQYGSLGTEFTGTLQTYASALPLIQTAADGLLQSGVLFTASDVDTPSNPSYAVTQTNVNPIPDPVSDPTVQAILDTIYNAVPRNGEPYETASAAGPTETVQFDQ